MVPVPAAVVGPGPVQPGHHLQLCRHHLVFRHLVRRRWRGRSLHRLQGVDLGPLHMALRGVDEHLDGFLGSPLPQVSFNEVPKLRYDIII